MLGLQRRLPDGDQMAVHVPLSVEAQAEAHMLMLASNNTLLPATGRPTITPTQDMVLGIYYPTIEKPGSDDPKICRGAGMRFVSLADARSAYEAGILDLHAKIKCATSTARWSKPHQVA